MPSPFPGMDPFLEHPEVFPDVHGSLIVFLKDALQPLLPADYVARSELRVWLESSGRFIEPDIEVLRRTRGKRRGQNGNGGVAVAAASKQRVTIALSEYEHRERYISIYQKRKSGRRLVTHIEVLSPSNKRQGSEGRRLYLEKQADLLKSQVNIVEIDLLRGGVHTTVVPQDLLLEQVGSYDYHICIRRFDRPREFDVFWLKLEDRLPVIEMPLMPEDKAIRIDLQPLLDHAYSAGGYDKDIDYSDFKDIVPPLTPAHSKWARRWLRGKR